MFAMALSGFRELRHRRGEAAALNNLAINARQRGEPDGSRALALEALRIYCDLEFAEGMADAVEAVAALDVAGGRAEEALRLYEVSDLERKRIGSALITPDERADRNAAVAAATESLGSVAALALRHGAAAFRFREVIDELLGS
jgi:hypothetical protein